jgi:signal transduction histidine kinase
MTAQLAPTLTFALAHTLQFCIFLYLYRSHRERFFRYLVWAWGAFAVGKVAKLLYLVAPAVCPAWLGAVVEAGGTAGFLLVLASALAFRWDFRLTPWFAALLAAYVAAVWALMHLPAAPALRAASAALVSAPIFAAAVVFWLGRRGDARRSRGERFLAGALVVWGAPRVVAAFVQAPPGSMAFVIVNSSWLLGYFLACFAIIIMVLERARSETAALKEFNERIHDALGEGLQVVDGDFTIRHTNRWMAEEFGDVVGRRCYEVLTADGRPCADCPLGARLALREPRRLDIEGAEGRSLVLTCSPVRQPDGQVFLLELVADVTERERLRARLSDAERLAAAGELAAGVAHEIRNPLSAIVSAATLLDGDARLDAEDRGTVSQAIKKEARRLNGILSDFLTFARPRPPRRTPGDIRDVVDHVVRLVRDDHARAAHVVTEVHVSPELRPFAFDADQMTQVLLNLALNAVEAMGGRGTLALGVAPAGGAVLITVRDTGRGIAPEDQRRIFEPFYSRKPGGSGLGLAIVRRIVAAHGGQVAVESRPGSGTCFTIELPTGEG